MRTLQLLVLAPFAAAIACGGGNSNDNPMVPTVDMSDAGATSMDTSMMDAGSAMGSMPSTDMSAMDAGSAMPSTDTSMAAMDAGSTDTAMDAGKPSKKSKKKKGS